MTGPGIEAFDPGHRDSGLGGPGIRPQKGRGQKDDGQKKERIAEIGSEHRKNGGQKEVGLTLNIIEGGRK